MFLYNLLTVLHQLYSGWKKLSVKILIINTRNIGILTLQGKHRPASGRKTATGMKNTNASGVGSIQSREEEYKLVIKL